MPTLPPGSGAVWLLVALPLSAAAQDPTRQPADLVVVNAHIVTLDSRMPGAEAMAVVNGRIVALGGADEIRAAFAPREAIDAGGATVLPGLIDAHAHVMGLGGALRTLDLVGTRSPEEIASRVRSAAAEREPGQWILGRGWDQNDWEIQALPAHEILDEAAPENPVWLERVDGHAGWVNAAAMREAGIDATTPDVEGGRIERDTAGQPTGVFVDNAQDLVYGAIPEPDEAELVARLDAALEEMASVGLTGAHDMGASRATIELYRQRASEGRLQSRLAVYLSAGAAFDWWRESGSASAVDTDRFRVVGVKFYADGALGSRGAALLAPYSDDPGNRGLLVTHPDTLAARVALAMELGLQPAIHAIGDRGNRVALDAIAFALDQHRAASSSAADARPPRIEHVQVVALEDIPRFAEIGVIASFQPTHATSDMYWAEERVGPERIEGAYAWRTFRDAGTAIVCGSDFPVESPNPFFGLYAAVSRQDHEGWPAGGWRPEERMTREEALACFTIDAARAAGMEDEVGSLAVGKRADFVIVDRDPLTAPVEDLWKTRVLRTVIDGETVYEAEP